MAYYRLEFLDSENRIRHAQAIDCKERRDSGARCGAERRQFAVEIWDYDRCVKRFEAGAKRL
jgi:hypothetical protein